MYNLDKDLSSNSEEKKELAEEIRWLSESVWALNANQQEDEYSKTIHVLALSLLFKAYFDVGLKMLTERASNRLGNMIPLRWLHQSLCAHGHNDGDSTIAFL